ncbi:DUF63 family protein [Candidatus Micrarchaeota archaeon]|nr:DUF63 family protein [Candidatus Micrarchaeota archaeon]
MNFLEEYFINPIRYQSEYAPYNVFNTLAYAALAIAAVYAIFRFLKWKKVRIGDNFAFALLPYVLFGGFFRVFEDAGVLTRDYALGGFSPFVTPGIYVVVFLILALTALVSWLATKNKEKTLDYVKKAGWVYAAVAFFVIAPLFKAFHFGLAVLVLAGIAYGLVAWASKKRGFTLTPIFSLMVFGQVFDGAATFVGTAFAGYGEQHVVGGAIISSIGPWAFFAIKIAFAFLAVEFLKKEKEEERNYIAFLIGLFGLAPGTRDVSRIMAGI